MNCVTEDWPLIVGERVPAQRLARAQLLSCGQHFRGARIEALPVETGYVDVEIFACCPAFADCVRHELMRER
jgi:hypothetical protein